MKKNIAIYTISSIVISSIIAFILMVGAYSIPTKHIRENAKSSLYTIIDEGEIYIKHKNITGGLIDNFTTSIMINNASFLGRESIIQDAMLNPRIQHPNSNKVRDLYLALEKDTLETHPIIDYPRYWHGYLTILKPLLVFFELKEIRVINLILQNILLLIALHLLTKQLNFKYALAFLTSILYLNPLSLGLCPQFSGTYYILLISIICLLLPNKFKQPYKIFLFSGIFTSFIDLLSAPLITLGFPLIVYANFYNQNLKQDFTNIIKNSIFWSIGYAFMWMSKWIIATIITPINVIIDGFNSSIYRMNGDGRAESGIIDWTPYNAITRNLNEYNNDTNLLIFLIFLLIICLSYIIKRYNFAKNYRIITNLFIGLYPFLWYSIIINHSIIHTGLVHRILAISIFAICTSLVCIIKDKK